MDNPFGWSKDDGRGRRLPPPLKKQVEMTPRLIFTCLAACIVLVCVVAQILENQVASYRNRGIQVIEAELERLPPPPGTAYSTVEKSNGPLRPLELDVSYPMVLGSCLAVTLYYAPLVRTNGWHDGGASHGPTVSVETFFKDAQGYHLRLNITCDGGTIVLAFRNLSGPSFLFL